MSASSIIVGQQRLAYFYHNKPYRDTLPSSVLCLTQKADCEEAAF